MSNKRNFVTIIFISFLLAFITGGQTFYNTGMFSTIILFLNYIIIKNNIKKIDSNFVINRETHTVFDEVKFKYILVNKSIIPIYMAKINLILSKEFGAISSEIEDLSFRSNEIIELKRSFICEKRGYYDVGKIEARVSDLFGFFTKVRVLDKSISIKVYPKIVEIKNFKSDLSGFFGNVKSNRKSIDDFTNIKSIREYQIGDNPKNIHFKLSAKNGKAFVKDYYESNYLNLIILVDGFIDGNDRSSSEEKRVSISLSITKFVLENQGEVQYMINSKSNLNTKLKDIGSFSNLVENVITTAFDSEKSLSDCLGNISRNIRKTSDFIVITSRLDDEIAKKLVFIKNNGSSVLLYLVDFKSNESKTGILSSLELHGIRIYYIDDLNKL